MGGRSRGGRSPGRRRRPVLLALAACGLAGAALPSAAADRPTPSRRPGLLVIVADDLGLGDVGFHGSALPTPQIDRIAAEGLVLDRFYAWPTCSLSRAALMTGRTPLSLGLRTNYLRGESGLTLDARLLPEVFGAAGYQTALVGKWHLGDSGPYLPHRRGFDHFYGLSGGAVDSFTHHGVRLDKSLDWQRNGAPVVEEGYATDLLADEAIRWLARRDRARPFLLVLAFNAVHEPLGAPEELVRKHAALGGKRALYAAMLEALDAAIGRVLAAVDAQGLRSETLVVFLSDNGGAVRWGSSVAGRRGAKGDVFEGGIRVPAAMRWPGVLPRGGRSDQLASVMDLLPTLAAAAGVPLPPGLDPDGLDLWPALREGRVVPRDLMLGGEEFAVIRDRWKLVQLIDGSRQLFDLEADPGEVRDLTAEQPGIAASLRLRLEEDLAQAPPAAQRTRPRPLLRRRPAQSDW